MVEVEVVAVAVEAVAVVKHETDGYIEQWVYEVVIDDASPASSFSATHESNSMMMHAHSGHYEFIPSDNKSLQNHGTCVVDQID